MSNRIATLLAVGLLAGCPGGGTDGGTGDMSVAKPADMAMAPPADMAMMSMADMAMMSMADMTMAAGDMSMNNAAACMAYCTTITTNCGPTDAGTNTQYADVAACNKACLTQYGWAAGKMGDTSGDTVACRAYHAEAAKGNAVVHCPHAGPSGGNTCGTWCEVFCDLHARNCPGNLAIFADRGACMTACGAMPTSGKPNDTSGDTIQCRIYHLGVAGTDATAAMTHCPHGKSPSAACK